MHKIFSFMKRLLLLSTSATLFLSCNKLEIADNTPSCIQEKIKKFDKSTNCETASVKEFSYQGTSVYMFDLGNCGNDMQSEVLNADCKTLGSLGGNVGNNTINGESFSDAIFIKTIWEK